MGGEFATATWNPGSAGRKGGHTTARWCPQPPMKKACLTLLSHLGRLHEPPVPKPRGTPKLSER